MPFDPVLIARLIQRRELKLEHVPEEQRRLVASVLYALTDAQSQTIALRQETPRRHLGRNRVFTTASS